MIVIFLDRIEDFVRILEKKKLMEEVFYEFKEVQSDTSELSSEIVIEITLHFLAKLEEYLALYETKIKLTQPNASHIDHEFVITELQKIFQKFEPGLSLIKGKIREIFLSYSY
jgi:biopolymer transport protein ExbB/TolQ